MKKVSIYESKMKNSVGIRLNGNENYKIMDEEMKLEIQECISQSIFNRYPDTDSVDLREAYSKVVEVTSDNIIAGNGSDEMISLVISAVVKRKSKVLVLSPDFSMYDFYTSSHEGQIVKYETKEDGRFNIEQFIEYGKSVKPTLIILSNPNNPTGHALSINKILKIVSSFPKTKVVIDEAYYEFYGQTVIPYINKYSNLIVTRTLSKAWGLAALRVGFLIANKNLVSELLTHKVPYNISELSQDIATIVLKYPEKVLSATQDIIYERERVYKKLKGIEEIDSSKIKIYASKGNYIFVRTSYKEKIKKCMEDKNIIIRYFEDNSLRITIGQPWENDLVINTINIALGNMEVLNEGA